MNFAFKLKEKLFLSEVGCGLGALPPLPPCLPHCQCPYHTTKKAGTGDSTCFFACLGGQGARPGIDSCDKIKNNFITAANQQAKAIVWAERTWGRFIVNGPEGPYWSDGNNQKLTHADGCTSC